MGIDKLRKVLRQPISDNARTRRYQLRIDDAIAGSLDSYVEQEDSEGLIHPPHYYAFSWFSPLSRWQGNEQVFEVCLRGL